MEIPKLQFGCDNWNLTEYHRRTTEIAQMKFFSSAAGYMKCTQWHYRSIRRINKYINYNKILVNYWYDTDEHNIYEK